MIDALNLDEVRVRRYCRTVDTRFLEQSTEESRKQCHNLPMCGTEVTIQITAETNTTMTADTIC